MVFSYLFFHFQWETYGKNMFIVLGKDQESALIALWSSIQLVKQMILGLVDSNPSEGIRIDIIK